MNGGSGTPASGTIAVIIPTYDHGQLLREAVESVLAQTRPAAEIIVVSDGAPVDPAPFVADLPHGGRLRLLRKPNGGAPAARHFGAEHATADYFIFFDDDDRYLPDALERLAGLLDAEPHAVAAAGGTRMISRAGTPDWLPSRSPDGEYFDLLLDGAEFLGGATMMRRDAYHAAGGYVPDIRGNEDWYLNLRLARLGPIAVHHAAVIEYREHAGGFTARLTQLDQAPLFSRRIVRLAGGGARGRAAGNRLRIALIKLYLRRVLARAEEEHRAGHWGAALRTWRTALTPLLLPWPSRSVLLTWLDMARRHRAASPERRKLPADEVTP